MKTNSRMMKVKAIIEVAISMKFDVYYRLQIYSLKWRTGGFSGDFLQKP
jgi:hypothetical protein